MELRIETLGRVSLMRDGQAVGQTLNAKTLALLIYLAVTAQAHSREQLADLLWSEMPEREAQTNLRKALSLLRPSADAYLVIEKSTVAFDRTQPYRLDVQALASGEWRNTPSSGLRSLLALYSGEFLAGFTVKHAPEFEVWMLEQREHCRALEVKLAEFVVERALEADATDTALDALNRLLALDVWNERAHRQKMLLLARRGEKLQALAQYQTARKTLADEFGVEPTPETTALYERIRDAKPFAGALPVFPTPFIGRVAEQAALAQLLTQPAARLVTLLGPGGVGKTRLALQSAQTFAARFLHGIVYVSLQEAESGDDLLRALAAAMQLSLRANVPLMEQLREFLRDKQALLLLDSFEQIAENAPLLSQLLTAAPELKMLVTSRRRLALQWEQVLPVNGLEYAHVEASEAAQLFLERARRVGGAIADAAVTRTAVRRICRAVEGFPLALELAASLTRVLPADALASQVESQMVSLASDMRDAEGRHSSLRAVFDSSWRALDDAERAALPRLGVFRGGFDARAAQMVANATPEQLAALRDKALVRQSAPERFELHQVLREFALERFDDARERTDTLQRHADYYMQFLIARRERIEGAGQLQAVAELRQEFDNVRAAWRWASEHGDATTLDAGAAVLYRHLEAVSDFSQAETLFALAAPHSYAARARYGGVLNFVGKLEDAERELTRAATDAQNAQDLVNLAFCWLCLGNLALYRGDFDTARARYDQNLDAARTLDNAVMQVDILNNLGLLEAYRGDFKQARAYFQECLALATRIDELRGMAGSQLNLGMLDGDEGDYDAARQEFERALPLFERVGDRRGVSVSLGNLGEIALQKGRLDEAENLFREAFVLNQELALSEKAANMTRNLGRVAFKRGEYAGAERFYQSALAEFRRLDSKRGESFTLDGLGNIALVRKDFERAQKFFREALQLAQSINAQPRVCDAKLGLARVAEGQSDFARAVELYTSVVNHSASEGDVRTAAHTALAALREKMNAALFAQAAARGNQTEL